MKNACLILICNILLTGLLGCAHQSKVSPSTAHIDDIKHNEAVSSPVAAVAPDQAIPKLVKQNYLPPPKTKAKEPVYSVVVNEVPVKEILFALARESKLNVDIHPAIQGRVTLNAVDQTLPAILERLSRQVDLTYRMEGNVLMITPDQAVLRTYKVDYVNMSRDTTGFIGAAAEISSTGHSASTGTNGTTTTPTTTGNGASNSSRTAVISQSKHRLWDNLIANLKDILIETDKEIIVSRYGTTETTTTNAGTNSAGQQSNTSDTLKQVTEARDQGRNEYKTLFASTVIANPETGVIAVRATAKQHEKVQDFLNKVMGSAKKQVLIEATIVEVSLNDGYQAGIDWSRIRNSTNNSGFVFGQTLGSRGVNFNANTGQFSPGGKNAFGELTSAGLTAGYLNPVSALGNIAASITLLEQFGKTKVLSSPKLMVLNNQTAILKVVDNLVYFTVQSQISQSLTGGAGSNLQSVTTTANTVPVGVVMSVTPQISETALVNLDVRPTISRVLSFVEDPNPLLTGISSAIPQIQVREMESV